jgi:hypothetical protein
MLMRIDGRLVGMGVEVTVERRRDDWFELVVGIF